MRPTLAITRTLRTTTRQLVGLAGALAVSAASAHALARPLPMKTATRAAVGAAASTSAPRGVFRLALDGGTAGRAPATIIIERVGDQVEATLLMDERITTLDHVRVDGDRVTADVQTSSGRARVSLVVDGDAVTGTLTVGKQTYTVTGTRSA